jgi:hypothetical protein
MRGSSSQHPSSVTPETVQKAQAATVLWVDDNPDNNIYVRRSLEALGVRFVIATSTDDGLEWARRQTFDAIIFGDRPIASHWPFGTGAWTTSSPGISYPQFEDVCTGCG